MLIYCMYKWEADPKNNDLRTRDTRDEHDQNPLKNDPKAKDYRARNPGYINDPKLES